MRGDDLRTSSMRLGIFSLRQGVSRTWDLMNNLSATHSRVSRLLWALDVASVYSSFPLFDYLVFYFFPFISFFSLRLLHNNNDRAAAPRGFFFLFFFCLELDGRRRAPKTCFISFRVKRKKKEEEKENHSVEYKPEEPGDYPATAHFVSQLKRMKQRKRKEQRLDGLASSRHLITWSAHVLILQPWPRVGCYVVFFFSLKNAALLV